MTVGVLGQPSVGIYTWGLNWGIAYELPNQNSTLEALRKLNKIPHPLVARRFRRDLYSKLELIMNEWVANWSIIYDSAYCICIVNWIVFFLNRTNRWILRVFNFSMGYRGRDCIYRALCEASQRLMPRGGTLVEELFKKVFR